MHRVTKGRLTVKVREASVDEKRQRDRTRRIFQEVSMQADTTINTKLEEVKEVAQVGNLWTKLLKRIQRF